MKSLVDFTAFTAVGELCCDTDDISLTVSLISDMLSEVFVLLLLVVLLLRIIDGSS